jgi:hypothetical protein
LNLIIHYIYNTKSIRKLFFIKINIYSRNYCKYCKYLNNVSFIEIVTFDEFNKPKIVSNETIKISAPDPINPANIPVINPVNVNQ